MNTYSSNRVPVEGIEDPAPGFFEALPEWQKAALAKLGFSIAFVIGWHLIVQFGGVPRYLLPGPVEVLQVFWTLLKGDLALLQAWISGTQSTALVEQPSLIKSIFLSLGRMLIGYGISVVGGVALGIMAARSWFFKQTIGSAILSLQSLPSICWLPLALVWFGLNERAVLAVVILGAMFSIAISTEGALRNIPPIYTKVGRTLGAKNLTLAKDILFFAALPEIIGGLKVGWTFAWRALMAGELIQQNLHGVGHLLEVGRQFNDMPLMFAGILTILGIGLVVDALVFGRLEKSVRRRWGLEKS